MGSDKRMGLKLQVQGIVSLSCSGHLAVSFFLADVDRGRFLFCIGGLFLFKSKELVTM